MSLGILAQIIGAIALAGFGYFGKRWNDKRLADKASRVANLERALKAEGYKRRRAAIKRHQRLHPK